MKVLSTEAIGQNELKILIYGESGTGKTSLAKTIGEPCIIISAEAGLLPLRSSKIDVIDLTRDDEGVLIPKELRVKKLGEAYKFLMTPEAMRKYKWVFIDSLSELSQNLVEQLQTEFPERRDALVLYGELSKRTRSIVKSFRDLPGYNVVMTALSEVDKDESGIRVIQPVMIGKFANQLPALMDEVFYLHVEKDEETGETRRVLVTQKSDRLVAKDRSGSLSKTEPADLSVIYKKIRGIAAINKQTEKKESK